MIRKIGMTVWVLLCLTGCMRQARLDAVMDLAGENRKELEKVLALIIGRRIRRMAGC